VIEAMLQSPNFLFWLDDTPNPSWKPFATASRLSYFLWNTMPDDALLASAAAGELSTPAGLEQVTRPCWRTRKHGRDWTSLYPNGCDSTG